MVTQTAEKLSEEADSAIAIVGLVGSLDKMGKVDVGLEPVVGYIEATAAVIGRLSAYLVGCELYGKPAYLYALELSNDCVRAHDAARAGEYKRAQDHLRRPIAQLPKLWCAAYTGLEPS